MNRDSSTKATALESLLETYTDSDEETPHHETLLAAEHEASSFESGSQGGVSLVSYGMEDDDAAAEEDDRKYEQPGESEGAGPSQASWARPESPVSFHRRLQNVQLKDIVLPPEPVGRCSPALQEKFARLYERKVRYGMDMSASIQMRKDFRNPSLYEKLVSFCEIDELGTNYPPEKYDPGSWGPESHYEELSRRQKQEMEKRLREKKTKVQRLRGVVNNPKPTKSKWDVVGPLPALGIPRHIGSATSALGPPIAFASTSKSAVTSAFGTLSQKPAADTKR